MTRQVISIGAAANDATGDPLRTAFNKGNLNFAELYAFLGGDALPTPLSTIALSGAITDATGTLGLGHGGTNNDFSATGGASQVVKQASLGAALTVGQLANVDLSDYATGSWTP